MELSLRDVESISSRRSRALLAFAATTRLTGFLAPSRDSRASRVIRAVDRMGMTLVDGQSWNDVEQLDPDLDRWTSYLEVDDVGPAHLWSRWLSAGFGLARCIRHGCRPADVQDVLASVVEALEGDAEYALVGDPGFISEELDDDRWIGALYAHGPLIAEVGAQHFDKAILKDDEDRRRSVLQQARRHAQWAARQRVPK